MVARVLFPWLICGGTRSHPQHRAAIKAPPPLPTSLAPTDGEELSVKLMPIGRPL
jgi:hypothetical protein